MMVPPDCVSTGSGLVRSPTCERSTVMPTRCCDWTSSYRSSITRGLGDFPARQLKHLLAGRSLRL